MSSPLSSAPADSIAIGEFRITDLSEWPFTYFCVDDVLKRNYADALLHWFETTAPWQYVETGFYAQYEFSVLGQRIPDECAPCFSEEALKAVRRRVADGLKANIAGMPKVVAHRLDRGQGIGIHNDAEQARNRMHRFVVQLNRIVDDRFGGHLGLFRSRNLNHVHRVIRPLHNSGLGFTSSPASWHAVSDVRKGSRFTLVYTFRERG